ncbi:MAG: HD domain-containing protein [Elusimicrobia bacterium]|jgi:HD-GYP domain-containing protein (c-di-GMP phosphodiesterase class II)|nr:HD domain-containing protein [Elusimicrobiota bacterium]
MEQKKDYKSYLLKTAKQMILIHDTTLLSKLVIRTLTRNIGIKHAGLFIYDKIKKEYIINVSRGKKGLKIPVGFTKITANNSIIQFFLNKDIKQEDKDFLLVSNIKNLKEKYKDNDKVKNLLNELEEETSMYKAQLVVPGFYRKELNIVFFIGNKIDGTTFNNEDMDFLMVLSSDIVMAIQNAKLFDDIKQQLDVNKQLLLNTVETLATAIDIKNSYTHGHTERVMKYSMSLLKYIPQDLTKDYEEFENSLRFSALLHDIGKIGIPESILNKAGHLLPEETKLIEKHPTLGADILEPIKEFKNISLGVKYHHERYDGSGYPCGLSGTDIPLIATIISVADAYDAMTSDRPYRKGLSKEDAVKEIVANKNKQFSPIVVDAFLKAISNKEL